MRAFLFLSLLLLLGIAFQPVADPVADWQSASVATTLQELGAKAPAHLPRTDLPGVSVEAGRKLVHEGIAIAPKGQDADRQSKHFVCTSCHNTVREDPDLRVSDPDTRLAYAEANDLPFLPGTTLYGVVNRETYYNGDYEKKYGDLVKLARHDLRQAIHLCATECAQGRPLKDWEMESILAYMWTLDLKMSDLSLTPATEKTVSQALSSGQDREQAQTLIHEAYLSGSPAIFLLPPPDREIGYAGITRDAANGSLVYTRACLHCHESQRYSFFELERSAYSYDFLAKHFPRYTRYSVYQVGRYGTSPIPGKKAYMPHYTAERMSNQQMEDLRAFVEESDF